MASSSAKCCFGYLLIFLAPFMSAGCAANQEQTRKALMQEGLIHATSQSVQSYCLGYPDTIQVSSLQYSDLANTQTIQPNGCITIPSLGGVRIEGLTAKEAQATLATLLRIDLDDVQVTVTEFHYQQIYLFGEVSGLQRAIPYRGPETVVDVLRRAGGITRDSAPNHVRLVRNSALPGSAPHVYEIDLQAILLHSDGHSNICVQANDQIYVPESKEARLCKCFHPWLQPVQLWLTHRNQNSK